MSNHILKEATVLDIKTANDMRTWLSRFFLVEKDQGIDDRSSHSWEPVLIRTNFDSFFDVLENEADKNDSKIYHGINKEEVKQNIQSTKKKIENSNAFNFLKNSSIWMRLCDNEDWDGVDGSKSEPDSVKMALEEFEWFIDLGLYEFNSAKEFLEYNVRAQQENYIAEDIGGHGPHVTPIIYSDETTYRDFFIGNSDELSFKYLKEKDEKDFKTEDVELRILLLDDKLGHPNMPRIPDETDLSKYIQNCNDCMNCAGKETCKLRVIKELMSGKFIIDENKKKAFNKKTYWADTVNSYCVDHIKIKDVWEFDNNKLQPKLTGNIKDELNKNLNHSSQIVQIIGVPDLESALTLMSCCKFDIIFLDYLLGNRTGGQSGRVYSTELFKFLIFKFQGEKNNYKDLEKCPDIVQMLANELNCENRMKFLEQIRDEVKLNRGPLDRYWIVPMTSYNSSFIADLQKRSVSLIDYRWNISQGADPINTPWKFLYKLNEFVDLQLRQSVYWKSRLMTFIQYTCEDLEKRLKILPVENKYCFEEFQQFMGAEYANFMKRYGARGIIERDAESQFPSDFSLFAKYIKKEFYDNYKRYGVETELNQLMQRFYHRAATMFNERYGRQKLREAFERLRVFIAYNKLEVSVQGTAEKDKLLRGLRFLHTVIDSEFNSDQIKEWIQHNPI